MSLQGIFAGLLVLAAVAYLVRRFTTTRTQKPTKTPDVPVSALLQKTRRKGHDPKHRSCH